MLLFGFWCSSVCSGVSDLCDCDAAKTSVFSLCDVYATCVCVIEAVMIFLIPITAAHSHIMDTLFFCYSAGGRGDDLYLGN